MTSKSYKEDAIEHALDWIRDHYKDLLEFTENPNEQLTFLRDRIWELYKEFDASKDIHESCYRVIIRRIDEALDKSIKDLPRLLMEKEKSRLFYPEAGKPIDPMEIVITAIKTSREGLYPIDLEDNPPYPLTAKQARIAYQTLVDHGKIRPDEYWKLRVIEKE